MTRRRMMRVECEGVSVLLLIVLSALHHTVKAQVGKLDMAPGAVDDDYSQCRDEMLKAVTQPGGLLEMERTTDKEFEDLWSKNRGKCRKNIPDGTSYHVDALQAYGNAKSPFRKEFNRLVYSRGNNSMTYRDEFHFKSLHFLLTDSLRLLNPTNTCKTVYYGTNNKYTADTGAEIRLGKFFKASLKPSLEMEAVESEGEGTMFNITSCSVLNIEENTCKSEEVQCVISPAEVFTVKSVRGVITEDATYTEITLTHSRFLSKQKCSFFHRSDLPPAGSSATSLSLGTLIRVMSYVLAILLLTFLL